MPFQSEEAVNSHRVNLGLEVYARNSFRGGQSLKIKNDEIII